MCLHVAWDLQVKSSSCMCVIRLSPHIVKMSFMTASGVAQALLWGTVWRKCNFRKKCYLCIPWQSHATSQLIFGSHVGSMADSETAFPGANRGEEAQSYAGCGERIKVCFVLLQTPRAVPAFTCMDLLLGYGNESKRKIRPQAFMWPWSTEFSWSLVTVIFQVIC